MFGWFKRTPKSDQPPQAPAPAASAAPATEPTAASPALSVAPSPELPASSEVTIAQPLPSAAKRTLQSDGPAPGEPMIEILQKRQRAAVVVRVQAGGRRVLARHQGNGRTYAYTKRADGTFRREHAPTLIAPVLVSPAN